MKPYLNIDPGDHRVDDDDDDIFEDAPPARYAPLCTETLSSEVPIRSPSDRF
jgi:hypothetical protein